MVEKWEGVVAVEGDDEVVVERNEVERISQKKGKPRRKLDSPQGGTKIEQQM